MVFSSQEPYSALLTTFSKAFLMLFFELLLLTVDEESLVPFQLKGIWEYLALGNLTDQAVVHFLLHSDQRIRLFNNCSLKLIFQVVLYVSKSLTVHLLRKLRIQGTFSLAEWKHDFNGCKWHPLMHTSQINREQPSKRFQLLMCLLSLAQT